ncbi:MAG: 3-carboxy-cis,cis-muconate cycloisomerase [Rhodoferax sp.]|jgi:3-carboxy-cis,cis-muconate cycloisomerase|nr:3-carboxy-cis,cis-muconate cycloisomerase [Rhodoferax sp.]
MSSIFEAFLSTAEVQEAFGERSFVAAMLRFEAALARAQADAGLIPETAAQTIIGTCKVELFDVAKIVRESPRSGSLAIPLVASLKETVGLFNPAAVDHVHRGCTSQDVIDTAMALVTRDALRLIEADVAQCVQALLRLAEQHAFAPVLARTLTQPASVTSFGSKCVVWAAPLVRSLQRLRLVAPRALQLQLGGTAGTLASMNGKGAQVVERMALDLQLTRPVASWHAQRDEWVALGCEFGLLTGSLGKLAKDLMLMSQFEVAEVAEPAEPGRGGPANMPHKHNPVACMVAIAAAQRAPQRVASLLAAMPQEHERALGAWQAELAEWPLLVMATHGSARALAQALPALQVDTRRMRTNLDTMRASLPKGTADDWFALSLAHHAGTLALQQLAGLRLA